MAFQFPLQALLRLRIGYEKIERLRLLVFGAMIVRLRDEMAALDHEAAKARQSVRQMLAAGVSGVEVRLELACEKVRAERRLFLEARLSELSARQEKQRRVYLNARQKREILENLRSRKWEEYQKQEARAQQQLLNDLFLLHRSGKAHE